MTTTFTKTTEMNMTPEQILYIKRMQMLHFQKAIFDQMNAKQTLNPVNAINTQSTTSSTSDIKYKTELCKTFSQKGICAYGSKCRFAHGKTELCTKDLGQKKYKLKECASFYNNGTCCYGNRCHFKHEERKINELERQYFSHLNGLISLKYSEESSVEDLINIISGKETTNKMTLLMDEKLPFMRRVSVDSDCNTSTSSAGVGIKSNTSRFAFAQ